MRGHAEQGPAHGFIASVAVFGALFVCLAAAAGAQDIEAAARARGIQLPQAYYERIASDPTAFTLPNGLFRMTEAGPQPQSASRACGCK